MILEQFNLIGFGKFKNKKINLKDGINLIYGENEAGKSTVHSFIDGMFYGFLRPNVRSALYMYEHKKYDPWNGGRYAGIVEFKHEGKQYRIEREFEKGKESTKVLEETTGVDITKSIDTGKGRILQPGIHFFGFNTSVFSNTIFIKQLGTQTDDKLANEVTERLINVTTALDDEISVDNAILKLKLAMGEIGTDKAHTKPYARNIKKIENLIDEKEKILSEKEKYESYLVKKTKLLEEIDLEEGIYKDLIKKLSRVKTIEKKKILEEASNLSEEIKQLNSNVTKLPTHENLSQGDYNRYEQIEEKKNKIWHSKEGNSLEFLKRDYKSYDAKYSRNIIFLSLTTIIVIVLLIMKQFIIGLPLILVSTYFTINFNKLKNLIKNVEMEIHNKEDEENNLKSQVLEMERSQKQLLDKYGVNTETEFKAILNKIQMEIYGREKSISQLEMKKDLLKRILANNTIESLQCELEGLNIDIGENIDKNQVKYEIDRSKEQISDLMMELNSVETNLNILGKQVSKLVEVEEEIDRKQVYKRELESKLKSLELATSTIEKLSKDIHSQFAPAINKKVSEIVEHITAGKYNSIRISESLEISVESPITKEIIDINSLSGGTIDQLYFSLRFGIINSMVMDRLPLILDDCFIQYDNNRLRNIIRFLADIGDERQIILFTCQNREQRIMDEMGVSFNLINLT